jgi:hypothetical protein
MVTNTTIIGQATRIFAFPELEVIAINDFTPGLIVGADYGLEFSSEAPVGSCCQAFRCYGRPNVGLEPLPTYTTLYSKTLSGSQFLLLTLDDLKLLPNAPSYPQVFPQPMDVVVSSWTSINQSGNANIFYIDMFGSSAYNVNPTSVTMYTHTNPYGSVTSELWPNLTRGWVCAVDGNGKPTNSIPSFMTHDPSITATNSVVFTNNPGNTGSTVQGVLAYPPFLTAYANGRFIAMTSPPLSVIGPGFATGPTNFVTWDINALTNQSSNEYFFPETCSTVASWGSISVGEFFYVLAAGGAVSINGDIQNPTSATNLPGVQSAGNAVGEAIPTPLGLIYCTDNEGVWVWNGGNTSSKLSTNVPDPIWQRAAPFIPAVGGLNTVNTGPNYRNGLWGDWVLFANNYMLDTFTGAWWQMEDPTIANNQVWCGSQPGSGRWFYSSPGLATSNSGGTVTVPVYLWDKGYPARSWTWTSNPIPSPGSGTVYNAVEICASNSNTKAAQIIVTPSSPPGRTPYSNQIRPAPSVTFTIPPQTAGYRKALATGWDDYNMCINVQAVAFDALTPAPTLHELNLGYRMRAA